MLDGSALAWLVPTEYDKLIRDRIPEIMDRAGVAYEIDTLDDAAYLAALRAKLVEEAREAAEADGDTDLTKELGDLLEVVAALMAAVGLEPDEVETVRARRRAERGGFEGRIRLVRTDP
jgi:predicted house-cleaning noncanonical NTP pyrophosphatase (MazG superfamily)